MANNITSDSFPFINEVLPAPSDCIPLFVNVGANVILAGAFRSILTTEKVYSSFPIIVTSNHYQNIYFSLMPEDQLKKTMNKYFPHVPFQYTDFKTPLSKLSNNNTKVAFYFDSKNSQDDISSICTNILNPLGIGAFYSKSSPYVPLSDTPTQLYRQFIFEPAPYSMEMIKKMFFQYKSEKFNDYTVSCLLMLKYPLPFISIPKPDLSQIGDRYIFLQFMLNNPPQYQSHPKYSFVVNYQDFEQNYHLLSNIPPFTFIHIAIYVFNPKIKNKIEFQAILGDKDDMELGVFLAPEKYNICRKFQGNEVDIASPLGGNLYISIIRSPETQKLLPKEIGINIFLEER